MNEIPSELLAMLETVAVGGKLQVQMASWLPETAQRVRELHTLAIERWGAWMVRPSWDGRAGLLELVRARAVR